MNPAPSISASSPTPTRESLAAMPCSLSSLLDSVICGDNCETLAAMPAESVDLVVTSPPYDDLRTYGGHSWDFERLAGELTRVLKPGGVIVWVVADATVNGSETLTSMRQAIHFKDVCGLNVHDTMIYASDRPPLNSNRYEHAFEYMFVFAKGKPKAVNEIKTRSLFVIAEKCPAVIFMFQNYGNPLKPKDESCKEPRDCIAYLVQADPCHMGEGAMQSYGGGSY